MKWIALVVAFNCISFVGFAQASGQAANRSTEEAQLIFARMPRSELSMILDAPTSFKNYWKATIDTIDCLKTDHFVVGSPKLQLDGLIQYQASYAWGHALDLDFRPTRFEQARVNSDYQRCGNLSGAVTAAYVYDHYAGDHSLLWGVMHMSACLRALGFFPSVSARVSNADRIEVQARNAVRSHLISQRGATNCVRIFDRSTVSPLPGVGPILREIRKAA